ncbi:hypothetical protein KY360_03585 [Candidatus Woesearchaeota archaeon]|nr:hypothetical protein [Candidatus Woesearchaeota archaeon]
MLTLRVTHAGDPPKGSHYDDFKIVDLQRRIFLTGDGVGLNPASQEASTYALAAAYYFLQQNAVHFENGIIPEEQISEYIKDGIEHGNKVLFTLSEHYDWFYHQRNPTSEKKRAGTTTQVCYFLNGRLYAGRVGNDGSIYLIRGGTIRNIAVETEVEGRDEGLEKLKALTGEDSVGDYLGKSAEVKPQLSPPQDLEAGDIVVMTTDGLDKLLFQDEIREIVQTTPNFRDTAFNLVNAARHHPYKVADYISEKKGMKPSEFIQSAAYKDAITVIPIQVCEGG